MGFPPHWIIARDALTSPRGYDTMTCSRESTLRKNFRSANDVWAIRLVLRIAM
jgi:hypothetical protein